MSETKLLPCPNPWCGASTPTVLSPDTFADTWCVECHACKVRALECDTEELAIAAWNTRTPDPRNEAAKGMMEALEVMLTCVTVISRVLQDRGGDRMPTVDGAVEMANLALQAWEKLQ